MGRLFRGTCYWCAKNVGIFISTPYRADRYLLSKVNLFVISVAVFRRVRKRAANNSLVIPAHSSVRPACHISAWNPATSARWIFLKISAQNLQLQTCLKRNRHVTQTV